MERPDEAEVEVKDGLADESRTLRIRWISTRESVAPLEQEESMTSRGQIGG